MRTRLSQPDARPLSSSPHQTLDRRLQRRSIQIRHLEIDRLSLRPARLVPPAVSGCGRLRRSSGGASSHYGDLGSPRQHRSSQRRERDDSAGGAPEREVRSGDDETAENAPCPTTRAATLDDDDRLLIVSAHGAGLLHSYGSFDTFGLGVRGHVPKGDSPS